MSELPERIEQKFIPEPNSGCWLWLGHRNRDGYGRVQIGGQAKNAHVIVYRFLIGPVPQGMELDHKCRVRCCVNPSHLEPVTHRENMLRGHGFSAVNAAKTHCINGHELSEENLMQGTERKIGRRCRLCTNAGARRRYAARRNAHVV